MAVACKCDDGDGPRHAAWHPSLDVLYVLTELSCRLLAFRVCRETGKPRDKDALRIDQDAAAGVLPALGRERASH